MCLATLMMVSQLYRIVCLADQIRECEFRPGSGLSDCIVNLMERSNLLLGIVGSIRRRSC